MDVLIIERMDPEVLEWVSARHRVHYAPSLARDGRDLRTLLADARAVVLPPEVALDAAMIADAPRLRAVGRLSSGAENIDLEACSRAGIEVVRPSVASAPAEAEFLIGALLQLFRRVPVVSPEGLLVGRELGAATVGIVGMTTAAQPLARLLAAFGARVVGYDPAIHASDALWARWGIEPLPLVDLMRQCDGVAVLLSYFTRYRGLFGERFLSECKSNQVLVSLTPSSLFDEAALAEVLGSGRMAAAWFDSMEPGMMEPGRPLAEVGNIQVTPRVGSTTRESRSRSAWAVARRIDELLAAAAAEAALLSEQPSADLAGFAGDPVPG